MLTELIVENLGVIERAELELDAGSSALTGETGAGKTLLVSALGLLLGARAERGLIRHGAARALVEARFCLPPDHATVSSLRADDLLGPGETEIVVSRSIAEGGGKVRINGRLVTVATLAELGPSLVEIAGQHEYQRITSPRDQLLLLDSFAGTEAMRLRGEVAAAVRSAASATRKAEELEAGERQRERELDILRFEMSEIGSVSLREGERAELIAQAARLEHAAAIVDAVMSARGELEEEAGAAASIRRAAEALLRVSDRDQTVGVLSERLRSAALDLEDVSLELAQASPVPDPEALEGVRQRIGRIDGLRRKYGDDETAILAYLQRATTRVAELETATQDVGRARREAAAQLDRAGSLAAELSILRREAAPRLAAEVEELLSSLAMGATRIEIVVEDADLYEGGCDRVEFRVGSPGHPPRSVRKIASGGELSRLALALRLAAGSSAGFASTLVFDEVDAGVGGEAARAVGKCLARLARTASVQVLVVTHLPQVAAAADAHLRVVRSSAADGSASALVEELVGERRVEELSRMLAGLPDSDSARDHAQELLDIATTA